MNIINCKNIASDLENILAEIKPSKIFLLTDSGSKKHCTSFLKNVNFQYESIVLENGDENKTLESLAAIWEYLTLNGADRKSMLINLGGGMVTDLGGFAASTFKRGINFINIPTTLLAMVDAAVGGKTGINFLGFKNEIGVINHADAVMIDSTFLKTLDHENVLSGYAEMLKHGLISTSSHYSDLQKFDWKNIDYTLLNNLVMDSNRVKEGIVEVDPYEKGIRKALNFGHTIAHAFEAKAFRDGEHILHGTAVALALIPELYISFKRLNFPKEIMIRVINLVKELYPTYYISCDDYETLYEYIKHDKKNTGGHIYFTLLSDLGKVEINQECTKEEIFAALDFYRNEMGI